MMVRRLKINKNLERVDLILKSHSAMKIQENIEAYLMIHPHQSIGYEPILPTEAVYK